METAATTLGNLQQVVAWFMAILLILIGLKEIKNFAGFLLLKLYEYFFQHS